MAHVLSNSPAWHDQISKPNVAITNVAGQHSAAIGISNMLR